MSGSLPPSPGAAMSDSLPPSPGASRAAWTRSLRFRLTLWYLGVMGTLLLLLAWLLYAGAQHALRTETDTFLSREADRIALVCTAEPGDAPDQEDLREAVAVGSSSWWETHSAARARGGSSGFLLFDMEYARIVSPTGEPLAVSPALAKPSWPGETLDGVLRTEPRSVRFDFAGPDEERTLRVITMPVRLGSPAYIQVAVPWDANSDVLEHLGLLLTACLLLVLLLIGFGGWTLIGRTLQPISRIVDEAERLDAAALPETLIPDAAESDSEVGRLVATLNRMMARLRDAFDAQRRFAVAQQRFAADASHELRTPLTILRGEMDVALARPRPAETYRGVIASAVEEIDRISRIVEGLSLLAERDADNLDPAQRHEPVDPAALAVIALDELRSRARAKDVALAGPAPGDLKTAARVNGNADQLRLLLRNLIENAVKYTEPGGTVTVSLAEASPEWIAIAVEDTGAGIAPEDLPHVFERFWRSDRARTSEGTGLGLAISRQIAEAHGGTLTVRSEPGLGSVFTLTLPRA